MAVDTNDQKLSFPQRNWFLLCVLVAILSPLVVHWIGNMAHHEAYIQATEQKPTKGASGGASDSSGAVPPADKDTSYRVAAPPQQK
jgi:hypothetical protein